MNIYDQYSIAPHFESRIKLKDTQRLIAPAVEGTTKLDTMFHENKAVKGLANCSFFIIKNILNKHFSNPQTFISKATAQVLYKSATAMRKISDKIFLLSNRKSINHLNKEFIKINPKSKAYIEELAKVGNGMGDEFIITNIEDNPFKQLVRSGDSAIFVLNHPNFNKDKLVYMIINSMLNKMYMQEGKQAICPRPKILVSKNMLKLLSEKVGNIYKQCGLTEVDAGIEKRNQQFNSKSVMKLMKEFVENKSNIFIFPEGNKSVQNKPFEERVQQGIAKLIKDATKIKKHVKVIPIGIKYTDEKKSFGKIFIGKPMYFKKLNNEIIYTDGTDRKKITRCGLKDAQNKIFELVCENIKYGVSMAEKME